MVPDPPTARPTFGAPRDDTRPWWRLQPGRPATLHGGTCIDWPAGRHPEGWTFHTRPEVKRLLARPDEVIPCPKCRPWVSL